MDVSRKVSVGNGHQQCDTATHFSAYGPHDTNLLRPAKLKYFGKVYEREYLRKLAPPAHQALIVRSYFLYNSIVCLPMCVDIRPVSRRHGPMVIPPSD